MVAIYFNSRLDFQGQGVNLFGSLGVPEDPKICVDRKRAELETSLGPQNHPKNVGFNP